jgi:hypothetical protein
MNRSRADSGVGSGGEEDQQAPPNPDVEEEVPVPEPEPEPVPEEEAEEVPGPLLLVPLANLLADPGAEPPQENANWHQPAEEPPAQEVIFLQEQEFEELWLAAYNQLDDIDKMLLSYFSDFLGEFELEELLDIFEF